VVAQSTAIAITSISAPSVAVKKSEPRVAQALSLQRRDSSRRFGLSQVHAIERDVKASRHECRLGKLRACATGTEFRFFRGPQQAATGGGSIEAIEITAITAP
jgi:hypothetical protein